MVKIFALAAVLSLGLLAPAGADLQDGVAAYVRGDYATAIREWKPLAEQGDPEAQFRLGEMHLRGRGVGQNFRKAADWYAKAADAGHSGAQAILGGLHAAGLGVPRDFGAAYFWLIVAAIWSKGEIRQQALASLGEAAQQLTPAEKAGIARQAAAQWRR